MESIHRGGLYIQVAIRAALTVVTKSVFWASQEKSTRCYTLRHALDSTVTDTKIYI